jgi:hypothetical protein
MSDEVTDSGAEQPEAADWPLRPWLLAGLLGVAGLVIHLLTHEHDDVPWQVAGAALVFFGSLAAAFTVERQRWRESAAFAVVAGLVMAGLAWRAVRYGEHLPDEQYGFAAGVVATALALPLFQAGFLKRRLATPYGEIYHHIWTDAISAAGSLAFTGISWVALAILSQLFLLLKIDFIRDVMNDGWFGWTYSGLAFGAALGTLRNQLKILATLQSVVLLVLSLLAVPLAVGLVIFLLASAISGPQVLWEATRNATPTLLACATGAFVLASVILRQSDAAMTGNRVMRLAAYALAVVILPLAVFAAVSLGLRLNQYGLAPERLWALVTVVVACAWGAGYWIALVRGGKAEWSRRLREANFVLALGACVLALLLALPILDFGRISAGNQLHRLESGKVAPEKFDFAALRWDFGDAGKRALARLARSPREAIAERAQVALRQTERIYGPQPQIRTADQVPVVVQPDDPALRRLVTDFLTADRWRCRERCVALEIDPAPDGRRRIALVEGAGYQVFLLGAGKPATAQPETAPAAVPFSDHSKVEVREVPKRYIVIDGKPVGPPLD